MNAAVYFRRVSDARSDAYRPHLESKAIRFPSDEGSTQSNWKKEIARASPEGSQIQAMDLVIHEEGGEQPMTHR
jgi:ribosomal protein L32